MLRSDPARILGGALVPASVLGTSALSEIPVTNSVAYTVGRVLAKDHDDYRPLNAKPLRERLCGQYRVISAGVIT
jgi:hypothetical protein